MLLAKTNEKIAKFDRVEKARGLSYQGEDALKREHCISTYKVGGKYEGCCDYCESDTNICSQCIKQCKNKECEGKFCMDCERECSGCEHIFCHAWRCVPIAKESTVIRAMSVQYLAMHFIPCRASCHERR